MTAFFKLSPLTASFVLILASVSAEGNKTLNSNANSAREIDYRSLSLQDCLALARKFNPILGGATERIWELTADYRAANPQIFPQINWG